MTAAKTTTKPAAQTPEAAAVVESPEHLRDVVAMPSLRADGSADQTTGFVSLLDEDHVESAADAG